MAKVAFVIRDINHGGAAKMMTFYANIAYEIFDEVYVIVIGRVIRENTGLKKGIIIKNIGPSKTRKRLSRIINDIKGIRKSVLDIKPDVLIPFASGNTIFTYLAVRKYHTFIATERGNPEEIPRHLLFLCKYIYKKSDYVLFQSKGAANFYFRDIEINNYRIIPNPYFLENSYFKNANIDGKKVIVSLSRLATEKNVDIVLSAFSKSKHLDECILKIYGDGPEKDKLIKLSEELGIKEKVIFKGNTDKVSEALSEGSIYILVSSGEGMPNSLIEAMGLGIPCITTLCMAGNTNDLVKDRENGLIVDKRNIGELRDAIDLLLEDEELSYKISRNALGIKEELSEERIHSEIMNFYLEVINGIS